MKKVILSVLSCIFLVSTYAYSIEPGLIRIREVDGSPSDWVYDLIFPNGSITSISNGVGTLNLSGGSGDITGVGNCSSGDCYDGSSGGGTYVRLYDGTSAYLSMTAGVRSLALLPSNSNAEGLTFTFGNNDNTVTLTSATGAGIYFNLPTHVLNVSSGIGLDFSGVIPTFDGNDAFRGLYLGYTNANHSGANNSVYIIDIDSMTGDAESNLYGIHIGNLTGTTGSAGEVERAIDIGTGWDHGIYNKSPFYTGDGTNGATISGTGAVSFAGTGGITANNANSVLGGVTMTLGSDADGDMYYRSSNVLTRLAKGTEGQVLKMGASVPGWSSTLNLESMDMSSATSAIPWIVSTSCTNTDDATACWDSDDNDLVIGDGSTSIKLSFTANSTYTFPTATATLASVDGALGTPSFTALNLPSSNADPGTTAGQIRHDSTDTASNSGGTLKWYDGAQVRSVVDTGTNYTIIVKTEFLPIAWAVNGATAPSDLAVVTGKEINARSFTEGDDVVFWWIVPNDYVGGIKYRVHYALSANANTDETVKYSMAGCIVANSGDLDCSAGTALTISDELGTDDDQYQYMVTDYSAESNSDWNLAAGALARLNFSNDATGDLATGEPLVIGIEIKYKAKIIGIAGY